MKGYPGSKYKKFRTVEEAKAWLAQNGIFVEPAPQPVASTSTVVEPVVEEPCVLDWTCCTLADDVCRQRAAPYPQGSEKKGKGKAKASSGSLLGKNVIVNTEGWQIAYSDGACRGNGNANAIAGVGVWWGPEDPRYAVGLRPPATA